MHASTTTVDSLSEISGTRRIGYSPATADTCMTLCTKIFVAVAVIPYIPYTCNYDAPACLAMLFHESRNDGANLVRLPVFA